jgi:glucose-6-phosphate isomerase
MLTISDNNWWLHPSQNTQSKSQYHKSIATFETIKSNLLSRNQGFYQLPSDHKLLASLYRIPDKFVSYSQIVVLGIGGSMLGPQAITQALYQGKTKDVFFVDNIDPDLIQSITNKLDLSDTVFLVQTKSGSTPETMAQYFYFKDQLEQSDLRVKDHMIFVTDPENGYLRKVASQLGVLSFDLPSNVGGRFSVLSSIGLVLAQLLDLQPNLILQGASNITTRDLHSDSSTAFDLACHLFASYQIDQTISVLMPYSSKLKTIASWYTQLLSESLGKTLDLDGKEIFAGFTPLQALGATDQHSMLQLLAQGPFDKTVMFLEVEDFEYKVDINPSMEATQQGFKYLDNISFNRLIAAELAGTRDSLTENHRSNLTIKIDKVSPQSLGEIFMFFQLTVAYLGELMNLNTFDQPGVERSKVLTKQYLNNK